MYKNAGNTIHEYGKPEQMASSEECVCEDNKEKAQRDSQERPREPEKLANGPVNWKLYFEISFMQRGQVVGATPFVTALAEHPAPCETVMRCRLVLFEFLCL